MIHTILLACSLGSDGCGAAGASNDMTRPADLPYLRQYDTCAKSVRFDPKKSYSMAAMREVTRNKCEVQLHIEFIDEVPANYRGPLVDSQTGKVIRIVR